MKLETLFENKSYLHLLLLFILCYFAFFIFSDTFFVNIMEARNFVTAREMIAKGNWLVPSMNGELRLAKPPLPTWITTLFGMYFGIENLSLLRFPAGVMGILMVVFMYRFTLSLNGKRSAAFINSLVLLSSFYVLYMSRTGTWDIYCHSFMLGAIWLLFEGWKTENKNWNYFIGAGILLGLSFLSKGPVAFFALFLPFLIAYCWVYGGKVILRKWQPFVLALFIFAVISFWWPVYIAVAHAQEAAAIAKLESGSWINRHVRPFYYYWNFPIQSGIWTLVIASGLLVPYALKRFESKKEYKFALIWTLSAVVLLSLFPEKKDRYLLPVMLPSAILAGQVLQHLIKVFQNKTADKWDRLVWGVNFWLIAIVTLALPIAVYMLIYQKGDMPGVQFIVLSILSECIFGYLIYCWKNKSVRGFILSIVAIMCLAEVFIIPNTKGIVNRNPDFKNIREVRNITAIQNLNFYSIGKEGFRIELVWEVGKEVKAWDFDGSNNIPEDKAFVVFSSTPPESVIPKEIQEKVSIKTLEFYDYNRYSKGRHRNKPHFQKYVSVITPNPDL